MRFNKKIVLLSTVVVAVALASAYLVFRQSDNLQNAREADANEVISKETAKEDRPTEVTANDNGDKVSPDGTTPVGTEPSPTPPTSSDSQFISITNLTQNRDILTVRAQATGITSGVCQLNLTQSDHHNIVKTANIVLLASTYACEGFDVPVSELEHDGEWTVQVSVQNTDIKTNPATINIIK